MKKSFDLETDWGSCVEKHRWGGEVLHTIVHGGRLVSVRVCSRCGLVRATRTTTPMRKKASDA